MLEIKIKDKEYKIQFGFNQFIDTDLMDRVKEIVRIIQGISDDRDITIDDVENVSESDMNIILSRLDLVKNIFATTRELLFVGFQKNNPVDDVLAVGDLIDDYTEDGGNVQELFMLLVNELVKRGFMGDLTVQENSQGAKNTPKNTPKKNPTPITSKKK